MLNIFSCVFWPSVCLLWRTVYLDLVPIFWWSCLGFFFFFWRCLYILEINPLSVTSSANIFSHSVGCLFLLLLFRVSSAVEKLWSLIKSSLFIFVFIVISVRGGSEKMLLSFMSDSVWPMFSSKSFIVSGLVSRSSIHFEFCFCVWC